MRLYAMANEENLIPLNERTKSEQRSIQRKGGFASGQARRQRKWMQDALNAMLDMPLKPGRLQNIKNLSDVKGKNITAGEAMLLAQLKKALNGDTKAAVFIRDTSGNKPTDEIEVTDITTGVLTDVVEDETQE